MDVTLKRNNGSTIDTLHPTTIWSQIDDKPSTFTPTSHTHVTEDYPERNHHVGSWSITATNEGHDFIFSPAPPEADTARILIYQNDLEGNIRIKVNGTIVVSPIGAPDAVTTWVYFDVPTTSFSKTGNNTLRIEHDGGAADWGTIYEVVVLYGNSVDTHTHNYLSLEGGTLTDTLIVDYSATGGDSTWNRSGIMIKNNNVSTAETALSMQNNATGSSYWIQGLNQSSNYDWAYGTSFVSGNVLMSLTPAGTLSLGGQAVVKTNDSRLSDSRPASDVYAWAKASTKPTYTKSEVGLDNVVNLDTSNPANITQSSSYRFVTDAEKTTWNNKQSTLNAGDAASIVTGTDTEHKIWSAQNLKSAIQSLSDLDSWRPIHDTPSDGATTTSISSNWAYDHANASNPHGITAADVGAMSTSHPANLITSTHLYMSNGDGFVWNDTTNVMYVRKDGVDYTVWDSGNLTNVSQLTNDSGYLTTAPVTSVAGKTGAVSLVKADVGLGNVDNTADSSKYVAGVKQTRDSSNTTIWHGTQAQYDAIGTKSSSTLYFITA